MVLDEYSSKNSYNDPDMLVVGLENMTPTKDISHFSLWAIMMAPLMLGSDLRNISNETL